MVSIPTDWLQPIHDTLKLANDSISSMRIMRTNFNASHLKAYESKHFQATQSTPLLPNPRKVSTPNKFEETPWLSKLSLRNYFHQQNKRKTRCLFSGGLLGMPIYLLGPDREGMAD